jgi:hypothetical protein
MSVDQVTRRIRFSAAHPEVKIKFHADTGRWEAAYPDDRNKTQRIRRIELRELLDELEDHYR